MSGRFSMLFAAASLLLLLAVIPKARAEGVIVQDALTDPNGCTGQCPARGVEGNGTFIEGRGWSPTGPGDRVVYELGTGVNCGAYEVSITNFDGAEQYHQDGDLNYTETIALNETSQSDHYSDQETLINLVFVYLADTFKTTSALVNYCDWNDNYIRDTFTWDPSHTYVFRMEWSPAEMSLYIDGAPQIWVQFPAYPAACPGEEMQSYDSPKSPNLGYLFVGRSRFTANGWLEGPIFSNVTVTTCCECNPGETEPAGCGKCGTSTRTCGADCQWGQPGACEGEGECSDGDEQPEGCGFCGTRKRVCGGTCRWGEWGECEGEGACAMGDARFENCGNCGRREWTCSEACQWRSGECVEQVVGDVCETGLKGICAAGVIKCVEGNAECSPAAAPADEVCGDGLDNDCDGETDNGCSKDGGASGKDAGGSGDAAAAASGGTSCSCGLSGQAAAGESGAAFFLGLFILLAAAVSRRKAAS